MMRKMKYSGVEWIGEIPQAWSLIPTKRRFGAVKRVVGEQVNEYERLALTMNGVIKRSKDDSDGLQPEKFEGYQILCENELVFKLIDLENVKTSRVGLSPYTGLVSPAYVVLTNSETDNRYFYYWFMFLYYNEVFNHLGGDGVRSAINAKELLALPVPDITKEMQKRIADYLDAKCAKIDALIAKQQEIIEKLKACKLSVITEAVTKGLNPAVPMKDSGYSFIGDIPKAWLPTKLKHITLAIGDGIHATPDYDEDGEYFFLNGNSIGQDRLVFKENTDKLNEVEFRKYKSPLLTDDTILITLNGATYGKTSFYHGEKVLLGKSAGYITLKAGVSRQYVRYYLQSRVAKIIMELSLCGSTIANLSLGTLNGFFISLPNIEEQKEITDYLNQECDRLDSIIDNREQMICKLTEYKKSLIYEVVTGKREV